MDVYVEELMPKAKDKKDYLFIALYVLLGIVATIFVIWFMGFMAFVVRNIFTQFVIGLGPLTIFFAWYGVYRLCNLRSIEYEYIITNNHIDIDRIASKKSRKHLISVDIRKATAMAMVDDTEVNHVLLNPPKDTKILNYSAGISSLTDYFIKTTDDDGDDIIVIFQPTQRMVEGLWQFNPSAVKKYNS